MLIRTVNILKVGSTCFRCQSIFCLTVVDSLHLDCSQTDNWTPCRFAVRPRCVACGVTRFCLSNATVGCPKLLDIFEVDREQPET